MMIKGCSTSTAIFKNFQEKELNPRLTRIAILLCLLSWPGFIFSQFNQSICLDGNYCPAPPDAPGNCTDPMILDEWAVSTTATTTGAGSGSCDVLQLWGAVDLNNFYMAVERGNEGAAYFFVYFNVDCDSTNSDTAHGGAEFRFEFRVRNNGSPQQQIIGLLEWDTLSMSYNAPVPGGLIAKGTRDGCTGSLNTFVELQFPLASLFDACEDNGCGIVQLSEIISQSGWSPNSNDCFSQVIDLAIEVNNPPTAVLGPIAPCVYVGVPVCLDATQSSDPDGDVLSYEWDLDYDGINFDVDTTGSFVCVVYDTGGEYTVALRVIDSFLCVDTAATIQISVGSEFFAIDCEIVDSLNCFGDSNGQASIHIIGGVPPYTYLWSDGQTDSIAVNLMAGMYQVTVTDDSLCTAICNIDITEPSQLTCNASSTNETCNELNDGTINASATGGTSPYIYDIGGGVTNVDGQFSNLGANTYSITITDAIGCARVCMDILISEPDALTCTLLSSGNETCNEFDNGTISVSAEGGTSPYVYDDGTTTNTDGIFTGLAAGTYSITITDANGCTTTCADVLISQPDALTCAVLSSGNETCNEFDNGTISVSAGGGTSPYVYDDGTTTNTDGSFTGLAAGTYSITITDANGCTTTCADVIITQPDPLTCTFGSSSNETCNEFDDGTITVVVGGGTSPYVYDDGTTTNTDGVFAGLTAGTYSIKITDANGCTTTCGDVLISQPDALTCNILSSGNETCNEFDNGTISVSAGGGTSPYVYDDGTTTNSDGIFNGLSAGTYSITITDANGCTTTCADVIITQPDPLTCAFSSSSNETCNELNDGTITVNASGGTNPYLYDIGATTNTDGSFTNLSAGTYSITVSDANGCVTICSDVLITQPDVLSCMTSNVMNVTGSGNMDGSFDLTVNGGTPGFDYDVLDIMMNSVASGHISGNMVNVGGLSGGNYMIEVTDTNNCTTTCFVTIQEPDLLTCSIDIVEDATCIYSSDGALKLKIFDGVEPYSYVVLDNMNNPVDMGNLSMSEDSVIIMNLDTGMYTINVTDFNMNLTSCMGIIQSPPALTCSFVSSSNETCNEFDNGSINVSANGGTSPYVYDLGGGVTNTNGQFNGLLANTYSITITDANGCTTTCADILITQPNVLTCTINGSTNETCNEFDDGTISVSANGGTSSYVYDIGGGVSNTDGQFSGLAAAIYIVTITDANGCTTTCSAEITQPDELTCSITSTPESCNESDDGSVIAIASGGTSPYVYDLGSESNTNGQFSGLAAGAYAVTITDANGCTTNCSVLVTQPGLLTCSITKTNETCYEFDDGTITATAIGGTGPYNYDIGSESNTDGQFDGLAANNYSVTITDGNGCTTTCSVEVTQPGPLTCSTISTNETCNENDDGLFALTISGGTTPYTYFIFDSTMTIVAIGSSSTDGGTEIVSDLAAGEYTVNVTDFNGCTTSCEATISQPDPLTCTISGSNDETCNEFDDGAISVSGGGGVNPYVYDIGGGITNTDGQFSNLAANTYSITVTDANGCTTTCTTTITQPDPLTCTIGNSSNETCNQFDDGTITVVAGGGTSPYIYDDGNTTNTDGAFTGLTAGTYSITITDANGCTTTCSDIIITQPDILTCTLESSSNETCNEFDDGMINVVAGGGTSPYVYDDGTTTNTDGVFTGLAAGTYSITITDANGCTTTCLNIILTQPDPLTCTVNGNSNVSCNESTSNPAQVIDDGSIDASANGGTNPYVYDIGGGITNTDGQFTGLSAGIYSITITDANGCTTTCADVVISQPNSLTCAIIGSSNETCNEFDDGTISVSASGGTSPYSYDNGMTANTNGIFAGLAAGNYNITVTDTNGCTTVCEDVIITQPGTLTCTLISSANESCNEFDDGSISVSASGGTSPYVYDDGATTNTNGLFIELAAGTYTITITDVNGCTTVCEDVIVTQPNPLTCSIGNTTNVTCKEFNVGAISVVAGGGTSPYVYDDGTVTNTDGVFSGLSAGTYSITITDANGCTTTCTDVIITEPDALTCEVNESINESCNQANDGSIVVSALGGTDPYVYDIGGGVTNNNGQFMGLAASTYMITITDANGCSTTCEAELTQPDSLTCSNVATNESCNESDDGTVTATAGGGTSPYVYDDGTTTNTNGSFTGLAAGLYSITITDAMGCSTSCDIEVTQPDTLRTNCYVLNNETCLNDRLGIAIVEVFGGTSPYTFLWSDGQTSDTAFSLTTGLYYVTVTDDNFCSSICQVEVGITDTLPPVIDCPAHRVIDCPVDTTTAILGIATASDPDGPDSLISISYEDINFNQSSSCPGSYSFTRRWKAFDQCNYVDSCDQNITVQDTISPIVICPVDLTFFCDSSIFEPLSFEDFIISGGVIEESCCLDTTSFSYSDSIVLDSGIALVRTYSISDCCGNTGSCQQTILIQEDIVIVCHSSLNISLDQNCEYLFDVQIGLVSPHIGIESYFVELFDENGDPIPGNLLTSEHIGQTITFVIGNDCFNNVCWGYALIEDKLGPQLVCQNDTVSCMAPTDPISIGLPGDAVLIQTIDEFTFIVDSIDNCGPVELSYFDQLKFFSCDVSPHFIKGIYRHWSAVDGYGNVATCIDSILVRAANLDSLPMVMNRDGIDLPALECSGDWDVGCDGLPGTNDDGEGDGIPQPCEIGDDIDQSACRVWVSYEDDQYPACGGSRKIHRNWFAVDECTGSYKSYEQKIVIHDSIPPLIYCVDTFRISMNGDECTATWNVVAPGLDDACSAIEYWDVKTSAGQVIQIGPELFRIENLPIGKHVITYRAYDECYNLDSCHSVLIVEDIIIPTVICDQHTDVTLGADGTARIQAFVLDDGSYDNCQISSYQVRRTVPNGCWNTDFASEVEFCCTDVQESPIMVEFRVVDMDGNTNSCWVSVEVNDKTAPSIIGPPDITISCQYNLNLLDLSVFGKVANPMNGETRDPIVIDDPGFQENCMNQIYAGPISMGQDGVVTDNCHVDINESVKMNLQCGTGYILRTFTATDLDGTTAECMQRITIQSCDGFNVTDTDSPCGDTGGSYSITDDVEWPCNITLTGCDNLDLDPENTGRPLYENKSCSQMADTFKDEIISAVPDACFKILRHWRIMDWCQMDVSTGLPVFWEYTQVIKVTDTIAPIILPMDFTCVSSTSTCHSDVKIQANIIDCTPVDHLSIRWQIDIDGDGIGALPGGFDLKGMTNESTQQLPVGKHRVQWTVGDICANQSIEEFTIEIKDCSAPLATCVIRLDDVVLADNGELIIWASDLDDSSVDNCDMSLDYRIFYSFMDSIGYPDQQRDWKQPDVNSSGAEILNNLPASAIFYCDAVENNSTISVDFYVVDDAGNWDHCITQITFEDVTEVCEDNDDLIEIGGVITTEFGEIIDETKVTLEGGVLNQTLLEQMVQDDGRFNFRVDPGFDWSIMTDKSDHHLNGVTAQDLSLLQRHLVELEELTSPYLLVAADINADRLIDIRDVFDLRKSLLGILDNFVDHKSWRMIDASYDFPGIMPFVLPQNVYAHQRIAQYDLYENHVDNDFIGVKIGDLDGDANPNNLIPAEERDMIHGLQLVTRDQSFEQGDIVTVNVRSENFNEITAYQFTLGFDQDILEYKNVNSFDVSIPDVFVGDQYSDRGILTTIWYHTIPTTLNNEVVYSISFVAKESGKLSEVINIGSAVTEAMAFSEKFGRTDVGLNFINNDNEVVDNVFTLFQNTPNPFTSETRIGYILPDDGLVYLRLFDDSGKILKELKANGNKGFNEFEITRNMLPLNIRPILYYQLESKNNFATKKMLLLAD